MRLQVIDWDVLDVYLLKVSSDRKTITKVISKWGAEALYEHDPLDVPRSYGSWTAYHSERQGGRLLHKEGNEYVTDKKTLIPSHSGAYIWLGLALQKINPYIKKSDAFLESLYRKRWSSNLPITSTGKPIIPAQEEINEVSALLQRNTKKSEPSLIYDCHGYTFTNGKSWIGEEELHGGEIENIIHDNGYIIVPALDTKGFSHPDLGVGNINPAT